MWLEQLVVDVLNHFLGPKGIPEAKGLDLGRLSDTGAKVIWPNARRPEHMCVVGKTGSGKTHYLLLLAHQLMANTEPWIFLDYHGDATEQLLRLAARDPRAGARLVVIDPSDDQSSPGLNLLEPDPHDPNGAFGRCSELTSILRQRWQVDAFGPRTEELLRNTLYVLAVTGHTLLEAPLLLTSVSFRQEVLATAPASATLDYWVNRFEPLSEPMKAAMREPLLNKITGFLTEPACRHFLGQSRSTVNFSTLMDEAYGVIVCLPKGKLREHAHTLGNLIVARLQFDIFARVKQAVGSRRLVTLFCDEVQNLAENNLDVLLTEGRKFACSLVSGQQHWAQTSPEMRGSLLSAGTHVFFRTSSSDASTLAAELSVTAKGRYQRELTMLSRGEAIARIGAGGPLSLRVPPLPRTSTDWSDVHRLRAEAVGRVARPRVEVETELQARRHTRPHAHVNRHDHEPGQTDW